MVGIFLADVHVAIGINAWGCSNFEFSIYTLSTVYRTATVVEEVHNVLLRRILERNCNYSCRTSVEPVSGVRLLRMLCLPLL